MASPSESTAGVILLYDPLNPDVISETAVRSISLKYGSPIPIGRSSKNGRSQLQPSGTNAYFECAVMSRYHATLSVSTSLTDQTEIAVGLTDIGSMHGTFVNGRRLTPHQIRLLSPRDTIRFGGDVDRDQQTHKGLSMTFDFRPSFEKQTRPTYAMYSDGEDSISDIEGPLSPAAPDSIDMPAKSPRESFSFEDESTKVQHTAGARAANPEVIHDTYAQEGPISKERNTVTDSDAAESTASDDDVDQPWSPVLSVADLAVGNSGPLEQGASAPSDTREAFAGASLPRLHELDAGHPFAMEGHFARMCDNKSPPHSSVFTSPHPNPVSISEILTDCRSPRFIPMPARSGPIASELSSSKDPSDMTKFIKQAMNLDSQSLWAYDYEVLGGAGHEPRCKEGQVQSVEAISPHDKKDPARLHAKKDGIAISDLLVSETVDNFNVGVGKKRKADAISEDNSRGMQEQLRVPPETLYIDNIQTACSTVTTVPGPLAANLAPVPRPAKRQRTILRNTFSHMACVFAGSAATFGFLVSPLAQRLAQM